VRCKGFLSLLAQKACAQHVDFLNSNTEVMNSGKGIHDGSGKDVGTESSFSISQGRSDVDVG
jgi:hypothetical protein